MITYLIGRPLLHKDSLTILVGGVGYGVHVTGQTLQQLAQRVAGGAGAQTQTELFIYTHVKEEALELFGFQTREERELFLLLIGVSGVGPKTALGLLNLGSAALIKAVQDAEVSALTAVPRVGKKLAQKIIIDLRTKLGALKELDLGPVSPRAAEVTLALQSLGFADSAITTALADLNLEELELSAAVRLAVQKLGKRK